MEKDFIALVRRYCEFQLYSDLSHIYATELCNLMSLWPFAAWGINIIGEIKPPSNGHKFIVVAIDYFSKWVEAESFTTVKVKKMARFIESNLIYRYEVPHHIMTGNSIEFMGKTVDLLTEYKIKYQRSSLYRP
ncbi:uncharacterized protein LOC107261189 [Ricinus communis]|uniref:uncharacterized protein LOC107261189 n=1 Tax=Ricinus communis TaxID=3988 RepID=UPI000772C3A3|nr:uncharacterized protein LOC107261189 [Ricinus communis]|eukprot:XP_015574142.1 uncharacterized protein LOC107261189 [Ricinus communis]